MRKVNDAYEPVETAGEPPTYRNVGLVAVGLVAVVSLFWWVRIRD